jgi:hypothetical protein
MKFEREIIQEEQGFDLYAGYRCLSRKLRREALKRSPEEIANREDKERLASMHPDDAKAEIEARQIARMGR